MTTVKTKSQIIMNEVIKEANRIHKDSGEKVLYIGFSSDGYRISKDKADLIEYNCITQNFARGA